MLQASDSKIKTHCALDMHSLSVKFWVCMVPEAFCIVCTKKKYISFCLMPCTTEKRQSTVNEQLISCYGFRFNFQIILSAYQYPVKLFLLSLSFLQHFYTKQFKVDLKNDSLLAEEIAANIHNMTQLKLSAVRVSRP
jgi:hypothetical protein